MDPRLMHMPLVIPTWLAFGLERKSHQRPGHGPLRQARIAADGQSRNPSRRNPVACYGHGLVSSEIDSAQPGLPFPVSTPEPPRRRRALSQSCHIAQGNMIFLTRPYVHPASAAIAAYIRADGSRHAFLGVLFSFLRVRQERA
ncbi:hypothetical protein A9K55_002624 [Cordyceps militaris]|uniref:Uncharacterized protein n=1 Tax=Cordyceps militaris TaxID=73501 RepID=A0A2H4S6N2_CORMI|nr:hypothetical protein A9K55_002624 [Cordyceps militaris]